MRFAYQPTGSGRMWRHSALVLVVFGLVASACGGGGATTATATTPEPAVAEPDTPNAADGLTGEFATFEDTSLDLASLQGEDVVLWFWAPW